MKLTADQILEDPATGEMWLRSVQQDPSNFLAIKVHALQQEWVANDAPGLDLPWRTAAC